MAALIFRPNLLWQFPHNFPTLEFLNNVNTTHKNIELPPAKFLLSQVMMLNPVNALLSPARTLPSPAPSAIPLTPFYSSGRGPSGFLLS